MARLPNLFPSGSPMGFGGGDPFLTLYRQMNRLFDDALRGGLGPSGAQGGSQGGLLLAPDVDVNETDTEVRVTAELPGVSEQDIEVSLREDVLTIRAEKRQERQEERRGVHVSERAYGTFQRELRLPVPVNPDQVQARFENGVLRVTLPKTQRQERSRRIQVQGAQPGGGVQPQLDGQAGQSDQNRQAGPQGSPGSAAGGTASAG